MKYSTDSSDPGLAEIVSALLLLSVAFLSGFVVGALATLLELAYGLA